MNLVVNMRKNSILAHAPPDKMAIIDQAVKVLDVAAGGAEALLANVNRMQVYRLGAIDPEPLVKTITELGVLDPMTRLEVDKKNKSIIAYAPLADHLTIRALVNKLDGSGRKFEVIQLRRLEADYVAGTVQFMMGGDEKDNQQQRRPFYYYWGSSSGQQEETSKDAFRVDADVENNRLLLWVNQIELEEVMNLLAKLGEVPARGSNNNTVRILNVEPGGETAAALERLRRAWPSLAPNPLKMPNTEVLNGDDQESTRGKSTKARKVDRTKNEEARSGKPAEKRAAGARGDKPDVAPTQRSRPETSPTETIETAAIVATPVVLRKAAPKSSSDGANQNPASKENQGVEKFAGENAPAAGENTNEPATGKGAASQSAEASNGGSEEEASSGSRGREDSASDVGPGSPNAPAQDADPGRRQAPPPQFGQRGRMLQQDPSPINVTIGSNGELIITSPDTEALDLFEEMVQELAPARREYKVYYLRHASAFSVSLNLEEYFEIDAKKDNTRNRYPFFYYDDFGSSNSKNETRRLSKRRELKFIYDSDTNTILVHGADPGQLKIIDELIELYDRPEPVDSRAARMTTVFTLKYSKAKIIGETVKDVYRDLLSSNDKALQQGDQQQQKGGKRAENVYITNFGGEGEDDPRGTQVKFKGKLSIGIDEHSNTLVVSTEGENLMQNVAKMIESLDEAAKPAINSVQVVKLGGTMDARNVQKALQRAFQLQQQRQAQAQQPGQQGPNGQQQQPNQQQNGEQNQQNFQPDQ